MNETVAVVVPVEVAVPIVGASGAYAHVRFFPTSPVLVKSALPQYMYVVKAPVKLNANKPIDVTVLGKMTEVKLVAP